MASYDLSVLPELTRILGDNNNNDTNMQVLNVFESVVNGREYSVVRYNKAALSLDIVPTYGLCRSLIFNNEKKLICFSPPKSVNEFMKWSNTVRAEEFVEGTMINVFWDDGWEISTRTKVGGETRFFKESQGKTFRALFFEACSESQLDIQNLNKELCYSFVMQHPENRIVIPFLKPALYLVAAYKIDAEKLLVHSIDYRQLGLQDCTMVKFPTLYQEDDIDCSNKSYDFVGFVLHDTMTGKRMKIRNPFYEEVKKLRGNQPKMQYHYLTLRKEGKVKDFLKYFPEYNAELLRYRNQLHLFTRTLHSHYVSCYIKKEKPLGEFLGSFKPHMFNLHKLYQTKRELVTNSTVVDYVNNLHPSLLMFSLNYHLRTREAA
jgi:hypothetical protein